jgi:membrane protein DedA with SNARE-associated domain
MHGHDRTARLLQIPIAPTRYFELGLAADSISSRRHEDCSVDRQDVPKSRNEHRSPTVDVVSPILIEHLIQTYGLWALFTAVMLESIGFPVPGETSLVTAALYAGSTHQIDIVRVVLVATAAAIIGDNIGYLIGRSIGIRLLVRCGRYIRLDQKRLKVGQYLFLQHGGKIVFFGRFVAILRTFAAFLAGVNLMSWPRFLMMNALGGICWASLFGGGAYVFGERINSVAGPFRLLLLLLAVVAAAMGVIFFQRYEKELEQRAEAAIPGPWPQPHF